MNDTDNEDMGDYETQYSNSACVEYGRVISRDVVKQVKEQEGLKEQIKSVENCCQCEESVLNLLGGNPYKAGALPHPKQFKKKKKNLKLAVNLMVMF